MPNHVKYSKFTGRVFMKAWTVNEKGRLVQAEFNEEAAGHGRPDSPEMDLSEFAKPPLRKFAETESTRNGTVIYRIGRIVQVESRRGITS